MLYSDYVKWRILFYHRLEKSFIQITRCLAEEGHATVKIGICKFIIKTTAAETKTDRPPRLHLVDSEIIE